MIGSEQARDLWKVHFEEGQEELYVRAADGGGIDGDFAVRDGGEVEDGIRFGQGVIAGVFAERAFVA